MVWPRKEARPRLRGKKDSGDDRPTTWEKNKKYRPEIDGLCQPRHESHRNDKRWSPLQNWREENCVCRSDPTTKWERLEEEEEDNNYSSVKLIESRAPPVIVFMCIYLLFVRPLVPLLSLSVYIIWHSCFLICTHTCTHTRLVLKCICICKRKCKCGICKCTCIWFPCGDTFEFD